MSNDDSSNVPASSDRREAVREKAQQVQAKHARARILRLSGLAAVAIIVVAAIVTGVVMAVNSAASTPAASPQNVTEDGGIPITSVAGVSTGMTTESATPAPEPSPSASSASTVDIRIYVDYLAPGAREFEMANASQLSKWVTAGSATLSYHPVAMLTAKSNGTKYSLRSASAAACVATLSPETSYAFTHELLLQQPDIDSAGMTDSDLAALAIATGATSPKEVRDCIEGEDFIAWARAATDAALDEIPGTDGLTLTGTPLVLVNGQPYQGSLKDPKEFAQFVLTTASTSYYRGTATPTPSPSATE